MQRGDLKAHDVPTVPLCLDIELLCPVSCKRLYTSLHWSSQKDLSLSSETEILFQGQLAGAKSQGSPVSSHLKLMYPSAQLPRVPGDPYSADQLNLFEP